MIISYKWLLDYLPEAIAINELATILTSIGLEVEAVEKIETIKGSLEGLVIGEVLTCVKHPNADKLNLTTVAVSDSTVLKIVCGAPNVATGQKVVVATVGTTVHPAEGEAFLIKKAKIRGEESEGMICAEDEIGLGTYHAGIMVLPDTVQVGMPAREYFKIPEPDYAIHIGLTPNRSDAMSHIGVAKDVCAYMTFHRGLSEGVRKPQVQVPVAQHQLPISVEIVNQDACPRYAGLVMTNIKVGVSPKWLQERLHTIGVRAINNVVDITNYVLHEYGQPLHAFDYDQVAGHTVKVQFLAEGTPFVTLDEKERRLQAGDLMICDSQKPMCMAGVFGGLTSGIHDNTTSLFLESAYFNPGVIRKTSLSHGLRTDAATHFEKSVDVNLVVPALERAAQLLQEICGAEVASELIDVYPGVFQPVQITFKKEAVSRICGKDYSAQEIETILSALGFTIAAKDNNTFTVVVPSNKTDVLHTADIAEEILRIDGLDNIEIPGTLQISLINRQPNDRKQRNAVAQSLTGLGFYEIITNSIVSSKYYPGRTDVVRMLNSLSSELDIMRPEMLESGLEVIQYNYNRKSQDLFLYEFGKVYTQAASGYREENRLSVWVTGKLENDNWNTKATTASVYYLKGLFGKLFAMSGLKDFSETIAEDRVAYTLRKHTLATIWKVDAKLLQQFDIKQDVFFLDINWDVWMQVLENRKIKYSEVSKYPLVQRDLSIVIDKEITYSEIQKITQQLKLSALREFSLFDIFESEKLGANKKSFALNYTFGLDDRTLTDVEIDADMKKLMSAYESGINAQVRGAN